MTRKLVLVGVAFITDNLFPVFGVVSNAQELQPRTIPLEKCAQLKVTNTFDCATYLAA